MTINLPKNVEKIIEMLEESGFEGFAVGGCVRDSLLQKTPTDWDITTNALPSEMKKIFKKTFDTGIAHGTITVLMDSVGYELTTYRIDGNYSDGRHPDNVFFSKNLSEDLCRRDFTINNSTIQLKIPSEQVFNNFKISVEIAKNLDIPKEKNQYLLDAIYNDIIEVRYRKEGDRIFLGEKNSKKIKEIFIDQKIPKDIRDRLPIFLYNDTIFWIYNVKKAYIPKINKNESKLIKVLITVEEVK